MCQSIFLRNGTKYFKYLNVKKYFVIKFHMLPSRFRRPLVFGVNQFAVLEYLLLHHCAVVGVSGQRAVAWRGAELHQLVAAEDVGVRAFLAVVAVKVLDDVFVVAFADQLAMEAAFDCAVAGCAVCIKIGHDLFF